MVNRMIDIFQELEKIKTIPTLPAIANRLLELIYQEDPEIDEITETIKTDLAMTAKILQVANSAYYGFRKNISNIKNAVVLLGLKEIRNIVMSITIFRIFDQAESISEKRNFWKHCFLTAHVSSLLSKKYDMHFSGEEFTGGLLHDIGKIVLDQFFHDEYIEIIQLVENKKIPNFSAEKLVIGTTHMQIGAWLGEKWSMPDEIIDVIRYHHSPEKAVYDKNLVFIVYLSNLYSNSIIKKIPIDKMLTDNLKNVDQKFLNKYDTDSIIDNLKEIDSELEKIESAYNAFI